jgi:AraC-like DNA-binding protein
MNKRVQKYREQVYAHPHEHHLVLPPIRVAIALTSRWGAGDFYERPKREVLSFNLVTKGNMFYRQAGKHGVVSPGELFIAHKDKNQRFETGDAGFLHKRSILVEGIGLDAIMQVTGLTAVDHVTFDRPAQITKLFRRCYRLMRDKPSEFASELSVLAYAIINHCCHSAAAKHPPALRAAIEFMEQNLKNSPKLPAIAAAARLSVRNCIRLFRIHLNNSPVSFFIGLKMNAAKAMLMHSALSIKQVAVELGYGDQFHFSSQFKLRTGQNPRAFRREYQKAEPCDILALIRADDRLRAKAVPGPNMAALHGRRLAPSAQRW